MKIKPNFTLLELLIVNVVLNAGYAIPKEFYQEGRLL
jgi:hypothetical protein